MKFKYGERVIVISGFYEGQKGSINDVTAGMNAFFVRFDNGHVSNDPIPDKYLVSEKICQK